jgi:hypothetical protein
VALTSYVGAAGKAHRASYGVGKDIEVGVGVMACESRLNVC